MNGLLTRVLCRCCGERRLWRVTVNGITVMLCPSCDLKPWRWEQDA